MGANNLWAWLDVNHQGLLIGLAVGAAIVAVMLILREVGRRTVARDPEGWGWRTVIGHGSGESVQFRYQGHGLVYVQPAERGGILEI